jgi:hypothetical protein
MKTEAYTRAGDADSLTVEVTPEMIEAGVHVLREFRFGQRESEIVEAVYLAMTFEREATASPL